MTLATNTVLSAVLPSATGLATGTLDPIPVGPLSPSFTMSGTVISNPESQSASLNPSASPQMANSKSSKTVAAAVAVPLSIMATAASFGAIVCLWSKKRKLKRPQEQEMNLSNVPSSRHNSDGASNHSEKAFNASVEMEKDVCCPINGYTAREPAHLGLPHCYATQKVPSAVSSYRTPFENVRSNIARHSVSQAPGCVQHAITPHLAAKQPVSTAYYQQQLVMTPNQQPFFSSNMEMSPVRRHPHTAAEQQYYDPGIYTVPLPRPTLTRSNLQKDLPHGNWSHTSVSRTNSVTSSSSARSLPTILRPGMRPSWTPHGSGGSLTPPSLPSPPVISEKNHTAGPSTPIFSSYVGAPREASRGVVSLPSVPVNYATRPAGR